MMPMVPKWIQGISQSGVARLHPQQKVVSDRLRPEWSTQVRRLMPGLPFSWQQHYYRHLPYYIGNPAGRRIGGFPK